MGQIKERPSSFDSRCALEGTGSIEAETEKPLTADSIVNRRGFSSTSFSSLWGLILCLIAATASSCSKSSHSGSIDEKSLFRITYVKALRDANKAFAAEKSDIDPTLGYSPGYVEKLDPTKVAFDPQLGVNVVSGEFLVEMDEGHDEAELLRRLKAERIECSIVGCVPTFDLYQVRVNDFTPAILEKLKSIKNVKSASYHFVRQDEESQPGAGGDPSFWQIAEYGIDEIWKLSKGAGTVIAVIDSGIDPDPALFQDRIVHPYSVTTRSATFEDGVFTRNGDRTRVISHGTQVAGVAAGYLLERDYSGIAPEARVMPIQVFGFSILKDKIVGDDLAIIEGMARAIAFRANIINLSLGTDYAELKDRYANGDGTFAQAMYALMRAQVAISLDLFGRPLRECAKRGISVVCSAGNDGMPAEYQPFPASSLAISVGAIGADNVVGAFSNRGAAVDCYAPGVGIRTIAAGRSIFRVSGTSFSAPFVAGILAIAESAGFRRNAEEYKAALRSTNFQGRSSLFPIDPVEIFSPGTFLRELGAKLDGETSTQAEYAFYRKYGDLYVQEGDSDMEIFNKIMRYYDRRHFFYAGEPESDWAIRMAGSNFEVVFQDILDDRALSYWESQVLAAIDLGPGRLARVAEAIDKSDYMSLIVNQKMYKEALPRILERIERKRDQFNGNTLMGVLAFAEREKANAVAVRYLRYLQANYSAARYDEDIACYVAAKTARNPNPELRVLLLAAYDRIARSGMTSESYFLGSALIYAGEKAGIALIVDTLEKMDELKSDDIAEMTRLQKLLNESTRLGVSYSIEDMPEKRESTRKEIRERMKDAAFVGGIFLDNSQIYG